MGPLLTPETFEFFAQYLLAGFVFLSARSWIVAGERPRPNETLIEAVVLSLINQLVLLVTLEVLPAPLRRGTAGLFTQVVAQPLVLGLSVGWLVRANLLPQGLRRLFLPAVRPVSRGLDRALDRMGSQGFVIVTFDDGTVVNGYFGAESNAGTDEERGGLYVERLYSVEPDGTWIEILPRRGAWLALSDARTIEFIPMQESADAQDAV